MADPRPALDTVLHVAFAIVAVVAGIVGVVMIAGPGDTGDYFSWPLGPEEAAAMVGGFYVASTVVFGLAVRRPWGEVRPLVAAVLALTLPTLVATLVHSEVFDFSRPIAIAWLILFAASPATYGTILLLRLHERVDPGPPLPSAARAALGALALALAAFALAAWLGSGVVDDLVPFAVTPMSSAFLGAWAAFLAVLAAWPAATGASREARLPLIALAAYGAGGLAAALTTAG
jgi:hypothetical protein